MHSRPKMTKWERIRATVKGEDTDRTPVALWRHFPLDDENPEKLAEVTLDFQEQYDWDLVKFTPTGTYGIVDWGTETTWYPNEMGTRTVTKFGVTSSGGWERLENLDVNRGTLANQNLAVGISARALKGKVPLLQTIFSPLTTARKLAGNRIFEDLRKTPDLFKHGLETITEVTLRFALEALKAGADGIFFATQLASHRVMNEQEYLEFGEVYDRRILKAIRPQAQIVILHIHGEDIFFNLANRYPVDFVNWHDRITAPNLAEARAQTNVALAGGVNEWQTLQKGTISAIEAELRQAIQATGSHKYMLAPGCVIPVNTPQEHIIAVRNIVEKELA